MAFNQIRGAQIAQKSIIDSHINGKLTEAVLDIKFADHSDEIFEKKLVVDYVQKDNVIVPSTGSSVDVILSSPVAPGPSEKGVILNTYMVKIRQHGIESPVLDSDEKEIYGKLTSYNSTGGTNNYVLSFLKKDAVGSEVAATIASGTAIDIVYPQRFTLADVDEMFAANERFVDGATDVTSFLNLNQLAKDIFGTYNFHNNDTTANPFGNGNTLIEQLTKLTTGVINTSTTASSIIDEIVQARGTKVSIGERFQAIETAIGEGSNLDTRLDTIEANIKVATTDEGFAGLDDRFSAGENRLVDLEKIRGELTNETDPTKGAGMVNVKAGSTVATGLSLTAGSATVQKALDGLYTKIATEITDRGDAVTNLNNTLASTLAGKGASLIGIEDAASKFASTNVESALKELYDKIVLDIDTEATARIAVADDLAELTTEVTDGRGTALTLKDRLKISLNNDGTLKDYTKFHKHVSKNVVIGALNVGDTSVQYTFGGVDQFDIPKVSDFYNVYLNGQRQVKTLHYTVSVVGNVVTIAFADALMLDDVIELEASIYAIPQTV